MDIKELIKSVANGKLRKGKNTLIKHLNGGKITRKQAIEAKCYDCNGMGESDECYIETCPLYPYSPYRQSARSDATRPRSK